MNLPILYLAFANNGSHPLAGLTQEENAIRSILAGGEDKHYKIVCRSFADMNTLTKDFTDYQDNIVLFHYAGHSNGENLLFDEGLANKEGVAMLLGLQKNLRLVFLNGCANSAWVTTLRDTYNTPAIMATSAEINDGRALSFASSFYYALSRNLNLSKAFQIAKAREMMQPNHPWSGRGFGDTPLDKSAFEWDLYLHDPQSDEIKQWRLPYALTEEMRVPTPKIRMYDDEVNTYLIDAIGDLLQLQEEDREEQKLAILKALPSPIGRQVRRLFAWGKDQEEQLNTISVNRFEQLIFTYQILTHYTALVLIAETWHIWEARPDLTSQINYEISNAIEDSLSGNEELYLAYDYVPLMQSLAELLVKLNVTDCFFSDIASLQHVLSTDQGFAEANRFLTEMKTHLLLHPNDESFSLEYCLETEKQLAHIFESLSFSLTYTLKTIKKTELTKRPHRKETNYTHYFVQLGKVFTDTPTEKAQQENRVIDNQTVMLLKDENMLDNYLSLSPLIIDDNIPKDTAVLEEVYFLAGYDKATQTQSYVNITFPYKYKFKTIRHGQWVIDEKDRAYRDKKPKEKEMLKATAAFEEEAYLTYQSFLALITKS